MSRQLVQRCNGATAQERLFWSKMARLDQHHNVSIPTLRQVLEQATRMSKDQNGDVHELAACAYQDPIITLAILRRANSLEFATNRTAIVSLSAAIMRLGWENVAEIMDDLAKITELKSEKRTKWLELHRRNCRRAGIVARIMSEELANDITDYCHTAALFLSLGDMVAVVSLGSLYVELAENQPLSRVNYRIATDYNLDTERVRTDYLHANGAPQAIIEVVDRNVHSKETSHRLLRPIVFSSAELIEAFDTNKLNKYTSQQDLPPQSNLRLIKIPPQQYERMLDKIQSFLEMDRAILDSIKQAELEKTETIADGEPLSGREKQEDPGTKSEQIKEIASQIAKNLDDPATTVTAVTGSEDLATVERLEKLRQLVERSNSPTPLVSKPLVDTISLSAGTEELAEKFDIADSIKKRHFNKAARVIIDETPIPEVSLKKTSDKVKNISDALKEANDSEQVLALALTLLVQNGFENVALIVSSKDKSEGLVIAARGIKGSPGHRFKITAPSSPIAEGYSKVQSANHPSNEQGPLGSSTFAVAPLQLDHTTPVSLYCDCGENAVISFEARRVFRHLVAQVNALLPSLPGGLLIEVGGLS